MKPVPLYPVGTQQWVSKAQFKGGFSFLSSALVNTIANCSSCVRGMCLQKGCMWSSAVTWHVCCIPGSRARHQLLPHPGYARVESEGAVTSHGCVGGRLLLIP